MWINYPLNLGDNLMEVNQELIAKHKLLVATPMYGGVAHHNYISSLFQLIAFYAANKINVEYRFIDNESLITRARNTLVKSFLESDCDILLFIDADIGFNWLDVINMVQLMALDENKKIMCGAYPKKRIDWNTIHTAYKNNFIETPQDISKYSSSFVLNYNLEDGPIKFNINEPVKVLESGTGFMMIHREVFDSFKKAYPEQMSIDPDSRTELFYYFDCKINEKTKYYLSEDYMFCQYASKIGYDTWVIPQVELSHIGTHKFSGSFIEISKMYSLIENNLGDNNDRKE